MVKSADTADLKSADLNRSWGFKSPSGHQESASLCDLSTNSTAEMGLGDLEPHAFFTAH